MTLTKPIKQFILRPDNHPEFGVDNKFHFKVLVFKDRKDMWHYWDSKFEGAGEMNFAAIVVNSWKERMEGDEWITHPQIGIILLNQERLGTGLLSHECCHAAFQYERRTNHKVDYGEECGDDEERFCYIQGDLSKNLVKKLYKFNLI